ncbi:MAG: helix-turn-helix transcriptional regulator [Candidatus Sericytochromatia bacterium]
MKTRPPQEAVQRLLDDRAFAEQLLTTEEAADFLNVPQATLRWWRHKRVGPKGFSLGKRKVMYKLSDVIAWREERYRAAEAS